MAYNGSGSFTRLYSWVDDRDNGVKIRADRMDAEFDGIATGLSTAILKDGTQTITADIPWGGYKITGLGDPTSAQDAATKAYVDNSTGSEFADNVFRIQDNGDATKEFAFEVSGITTGTTRTWTVPDANITFGAYAPTLLNVANEAGFKAAVNLEIGTDVQAYSATLGTLAGASDASHLTDIAGLTLADGDIFYVSSGAITNLAKGTDGQFLSLASGVPAWADAGGGLVFIASTDLANDATANFTGFDAASYDVYLFVLQNVIPASDGDELWVRTSTDGGSGYDSGASDYAYNFLESISSGSTISNRASTGDTKLKIVQAAGSAAGEHGVSGVVHIHGPHLGKKTVITHHTVAFDGAGNPRSYFGGGARMADADVDAIQFLFSTGNLESGTITMYGISNA